MFYLFLQTRMLRILHLITCYAGASPQGEAFLKILHCTSFEANSTFRLLCAKGGGTACRDGGIVLSLDKVRAFYVLHSALGDYIVVII